MSSFLKVENLSKSFQIRKKSSLFKGLLHPDYHTVQAVDSINLSLNAGERVAFVGPNGAGKSTTIKILAGILHPTSGEVKIDGLTPWIDRTKLSYKIGTVFGQRSQLWYHLPARDTFELLSYAYDLKRSDFIERSSSLISAFEADHIVDKPVRQLSLGERMRCEIIASLLHRPTILFLDEPTVGLDVVSKAIIRDLVKQTSDQDGTTVLLTSHDTGDMERVCDRVIVIDHGHLVTDTPIRDLRSGYISEKLITLALKEERVDIEAKGVRLIEHKPHQLVIAVDTRHTSVEAVLQDLMKKSSLVDITVEDPPMEDIIKKIYATGWKAA